jgi:hypothetical protein
VVVVIVMLSAEVATFLFASPRLASRGARRIETARG